MDQNEVIDKYNASTANTPNGHIDGQVTEAWTDSQDVMGEGGQSHTADVKTANIQNPDSRNSSLCDSDIEEDGSFGEDDHGNSGDESDLDDNPEMASAEPVNTSANTELPDTVTVLDAENGGKVYIVGTAHFSKNSQDDVAKVCKISGFCFVPKI